jgi:hypothetical protein
MVPAVGRAYCWIEQPGRGFSLARYRMVAKRTASRSLIPRPTKAAGAVRLFSTRLSHSIRHLDRGKRPVVERRLEGARSD